MDEWLQERDAILDDLRYNLVQAQQRMKKSADGHRRDEEFHVGDSVYLKIQPYRQKSLVRKPNEKLSARFYDPFVITQKVEAVAYKLDLPPESKIHSVFHGVTTQTLYWTCTSFSYNTTSAHCRYGVSAGTKTIAKRSSHSAH